MVRAGRKGQRRAKKPTAEESYLQEIQNELKKNKHRICETVCILPSSAIVETSAAGVSCNQLADGFYLAYKEICLHWNREALSHDITVMC